MIKKTTWGLLGAVLLIAPAAPARAEIMLSFDPVNQHADVGEQIDVGVRISGLGTNAPPSLGAFDLTVAFNDFVLDFAGMPFGDPVFGDQLDLFSLGSITGVSEDPNPDVGLVDFFEISLDASSDLDTMQEGAFILAVLTFDAVNSGVSPLNFASVVLADSLGNPLTATTSSGFIAMPEPDTLALLTVGLAGLGFIGWRRRRGHLIQAV